MSAHRKLLPWLQAEFRSERLLTLNRAGKAQDAARGADDYELIHLAETGKH